MVTTCSRSAKKKVQLKLPENVNAQQAESSQVNVGFIDSDNGRRERLQNSYKQRVDWLASITKNRGLPHSTDDLQFRQSVRSKPVAIVIAVDCSASTLRGGALSAAKGAVHDLMQQAYKKRARVGLLVFSGEGVKVVKPITKVARSSLKPELNAIAGGGGTPLLGAWRRSLELLYVHSRAHNSELKLFFLTDGRASLSNFDTSLEPTNKHYKHIQSTIIDIERQPVRLAKAQELARLTRSQYVYL